MARFAIQSRRSAWPRIAAVTLAAVLAATTTATAQISWHEKSTFAPSKEAWTGVEAFKDVLSLYSGVTMAPFGTLNEDGLRLRVTGGISRYRYSGPRYNAAAGSAVTVDFKGESHFLEALVGYQWRTGDLTLKAFAGVAFADIIIAPYDPETLVQGQGHGAKGAIEAWYAIASHSYVALDLAASEVHRTYSARLRLGMNAGPRWWVGPELQRNGHREADTNRLGAFVRYDHEGMELSMSGGLLEPADGQSGTYLTGQVLMRF